MENSICLGYLGPKGTFSELAAHQYCQGKGWQLVECSSLEDIIKGVVSGMLDKGIVPVENSTEGSVGLVYDLLAGPCDLAIEGEIIVPVVHSLLARSKVSMEKIEKVFSHPQALAQCRDFLRKNLPHVYWQECTSTAAAAMLVAESEQPWAALAPATAAAVYGLDVLIPQANDYPNNMTRFFAIGREQLSSRSFRCKTSLVFGVCDRPGALYLVLREFALRGINLTRIESRPSKNKLGEYIFFLDFLGSTADLVVRDLLCNLSNITTYLKLLGSYPAAE
ncbi:MAG: prephenate dehydratase [Thermacetogeniaceae bacterium]|jgi:prephenate dehydratase|nr:prephenate dehydratase [Thermoanaerobacterales bacterium]NLN22165.1 prephenate dehydratase [Syntrophomonadaceae bacterium]HAF17717.1 prephenate dehydratase [Peptococcaceae bacterium]